MEASPKETVSCQSVAKKGGVEALFQSVCRSHSLLTDDVVNNQAFMSCVQSSQSFIMYYLKLRNQYHTQSHKQRKSSLQQEIEKVDTRIKSLIDLIARACKIN